MTEKDNQIRTPSGMGGLVSYNEGGVKSKFQITPEMVTIMIGVVVLGSAALRYFI